MADGHVMPIHVAVAHQLEQAMIYSRSSRAGCPPNSSSNDKTAQVTTVKCFEDSVAHGKDSFQRGRRIVVTKWTDEFTGAAPPTRRMRQHAGIGTAGCNAQKGFGADLWMHSCHWGSTPPHLVLG